jgi:hypothetical protein
VTTEAENLISLRSLTKTYGSGDAAFEFHFKQERRKND